MASGFLGEFVLPLLKGGTLHVGRPVGWPALARLQARLARAEGVLALQAAEIAQRRQAYAARMLAQVAPLQLEQASLRLLAAAHNLMVLGHPEMKGRERDQERVAELARDLAQLGPPAQESEAVARISLLARLPEAVRVEHQLQVGPAWLRVRLHQQGGALGLPLRTLAHLPSAQVQSRRRPWWKEIGVPACADPALEALFRACPVLETLDPLRLHPPLSWRRILPVLRFPSLSRAFANRIVELGTEAAGSAVAGALLRFASVAEGREPLASPREAALGIRFVAHVFWLDQLWGEGRELDPGCDLAALLAAASESDARLLWPPDVSRESEPGTRVAKALQRLQSETPKRIPDRYRAMRALCELGMSEARLACP